MKKNTKGIILFISLVIIVVSCILGAVYFSQQEENRLIDYCMGLNWTEQIPENYTGPNTTKSTWLMEYREGWYTLFYIELQHNKYPWKDMIVSLQFNENTGEHFIDFKKELK